MFGCRFSRAEHLDVGWTPRTSLGKEVGMPTLLVQTYSTIGKAIAGTVYLSQQDAR